MYETALLQSGTENQVIVPDGVSSYYVLGAFLYILCVLVYLILITLSGVSIIIIAIFID